MRGKKNIDLSLGSLKHLGKILHSLEVLKGIDFPRLVVRITRTAALLFTKQSRGEWCQMGAVRFRPQHHSTAPANRTNKGNRREWVIGVTNRTWHRGPAPPLRRHVCAWASLG